MRPASDEAMTAACLSFPSETCRAAPAVSTVLTGSSPSSLIVRRHCARACGWLLTVLRSDRAAPFGASRQWFTRRNVSSTMWRCVLGSM